MDMNFEQYLKENLLWGNLCEGAERFNGGQNQMWKGFVLTNNGEVEAYIKKCRARDTIYIEIIVALVGRIYGLPIPKPIIVKVEPDHPDICVAETTFLYGSEAHDSPNFERFLSLYNCNEDLILEYSNLHKILAFDELIANPDRNKGNILYDGATFQFIDHEYCFARNQNPRAEILDDWKTRNIADIYRDHHGENDVLIHKTMQKVKKYIKDELQATYSDAILVLDGVSFDGQSYSSKVSFVKNFILERLPVLEVLLKNSISYESGNDQFDWIEVGG